MEVKKGYKQTEMGNIPEDWDLREFVEVMDGFTSGQTPYRGVPSYFKGNIPWITSGELNYNIITDTNEKITKDGVKDANLKMIPKGTFLFAITGLEAEGTRGSCAITGVEATTNQSCMALYPKKNLLITPYLYHYYVRYGNQLALKYCQGTKQQSYTGGIAKKLPIIVPPKVSEQTAIATALSDTDALISSLEKLIAKKRNIKQGAMQELLRPKKGWDIRMLGDLLDKVVGGGTPSRSNKDYWGKEIPWVTVKDFSTFNPFQTQEYITKKGLENSASNLIPRNTLITSTRMGLGKAVIYKIDVSINQDLKALFPSKHLNSMFLYYWFQRNSEMIEKLGSGSTVLGISLSELKGLKVDLPSIKEQQNIADMLLDMDSEITILESKLTKYRQIKSGMMQSLLTGKIRLV
jgi:type I restriction enzyme, S subunit